MTVEELSPETAPGVVYERYLREGVLAFQRCVGCEGVVFYPRVLCPACGSDDLRWSESDGVGTVYSATINYARGEEPRNISLIDLDDGFRMMSSVVGVPASDVFIGMRVQVRIDPDAESPRPLFHREDR